MEVKNGQTNLLWGKEPIIYRVIYGDTDKAGVVYYANYLRLFEIGRTEWMRHMLKVSYKSLEKKGIMFPVVEAYIRYKAPALYDDVIHIHTALQEATKISLTFYYEIKKENKILVTGTTKHASTDTNGKLTKIPKGLIDAFS